MRINCDCDILTNSNLHQSLPENLLNSPKCILLKFIFKKKNHEKVFSLWTNNNDNINSEKEGNSEMEGSELEMSSNSPKTGQIVISDDDDRDLEILNDSKVMILMMIIISHYHHQSLQEEWEKEEQQEKKEKAVEEEEQDQKVW